MSAAAAAAWLVPGHLTCVKLLLEEGADIEQRNVVRAAQNPHVYSH
jgi:hypothetical protein